ncbi:MAG TPA: PAS domain-containing protein [Terracidiphilus sp.]|jgi:PAS domain S-box-containing protein
MPLNIPNSESMARWRWYVRFPLGCLLALGSVELTVVIGPLRAFPLLLAFPTVILAAWFLGMWGAAGCALTDVVLVDAFLTRSQFRFATGNASEVLRLAMFVLITMLIGWSVRRLSAQKAQMARQEIEGKLQLAEAQRQLAEERARVSEQLRYRDDVLQMALQASGMGLWVWDLQQDIVHRSDAVYRMVGCEPGEFGSDPDEWLQFVHPDDIPPLQEASGLALAEGTDYHMQYRIRWPDGSLHWIDSLAKCQRDSGGKLVRIVGVMADVTKRRQADDALLRAEKLAVAGRLAASVAHEINNPLEAVANLLYLITIADSAEQARVQASDALDELMRISLVAQSTLKFHRESGAARMTLLSEVMDSVLMMFRGKLENMAIAVTMDASEELPITCMVSETHQIFANLVANAIESMQPRGFLRLRIHPSCDWRQRSARGMRVTIYDTGEGISRAGLGRIFEPFFTTKPETGTGLGLWVVAQLVERHKGGVHVWSSQRAGASGTAFSVFLPFGESHEDRHAGSRKDPKSAAKPRAEIKENYVPGQFLQHQGV